MELHLRLEQETSLDEGLYAAMAQHVIDRFGPGIRYEVVETGGEVRSSSEDYSDDPEPQNLPRLRATLAEGTPWDEPEQYTEVKFD